MSLHSLRRLALPACCLLTLGITFALAADHPVSNAQTISTAQARSAPVAPDDAQAELAVLGDVDQFAEVVSVAEFVLPKRLQDTVFLDAFLEAAAQPDTVLLDTRSKSAFEAIHLEGAVNLEFADLSPESLAKVIPTKQTQVLIYCNNNFIRVDGRSFTEIEGKSFVLALNIPTYTTLARLGYSNVRELVEGVNVTDPRLSWAGSKANELEKLRKNDLGPRSVSTPIKPLQRSFGDGVILDSNDPTTSNVDFRGFVDLANVEAQLPLANPYLGSDTVRLDPRSDVSFAADPDPNATHVNFSDFTEPKLRKLFPDTETPIVVVNAGDETPTSLGPLTVVNLRGYGYQNVSLAIPGASQPAVAAKEDGR